MVARVYVQGSGGVSSSKVGGSGGGAIVVLANATVTTYAEINGTVRVNGLAGTGAGSGDTGTCGGMCGGGVCVMGSVYCGCECCPKCAACELPLSGTCVAVCR